MTDRRGSGTGLIDRPGAPKPAVDPRLRARRIEVRRSEGRRRLRRLLVLLAITVVCVSAWGISRSPLLDVDTIEVTGAPRTGHEDVVDAAGVVRGDPLVDVDLSRSRSAIADLPWVESVTVTRSWWGTIRYDVVERAPVAVVTAGSAPGPRVLVDRTGVVLAFASPSDETGLVVVEGLEPPSPGAQFEPADRTAISAAVALTPGLRGAIEAVEVDEVGDVWLRVAPALIEVPGPDPARVRLGDAREVTDQVVAAETVLARVVLDCLGIVDVRIASSPVVTRQPGCEEA